MPFAERLKTLRTQAGLSQKELADRAGMHKMGVVKLELGKRKPTWESVQALASALGVDCTAFADPPKPSKPRRPQKGKGE